MAGTHRCYLGFDMLDIHPGVEEFQTSEVPVGPSKSAFNSSRGTTGRQSGRKKALKTHKFDRNRSVGNNIGAFGGEGRQLSTNTPIV